MNTDLFANDALWLLGSDDKGCILHASPPCVAAGFAVGASLADVLGAPAQQLLTDAAAGPIDRSFAAGTRAFRFVGGRASFGYCFSLTPADAADARKLAIVEQLLGDSNVSLFATDLDGRLQFAMGGAEEAQALRSTPDQNVLDIHRDTPTEACLRLAMEGTPTAILNEPLPGRFFDDRYLPVHGEDGSVVGAAGFAINVSDRVQSEFRLRETVERLEKQSTALRALSTPIIRVWDEIICLPVVGIVDSQRTADMMESLLSAIVEESARYAIVDLTGVEVVDTSTAEHLLRLFRAASILGVKGVLCGIRPAVAQTIVTLGVDLTGINTLRTLEEALRYCFVQRLNGRTKKRSSDDASKKSATARGPA